MPFVQIAMHSVQLLFRCGNLPALTFRIVLIPSFQQKVKRLCHDSL